MSELNQKIWAVVGPRGMERGGMTYAKARKFANGKASAFESHTLAIVTTEAAKRADEQVTDGLLEDVERLLDRRRKN